MNRMRHWERIRDSGRALRVLAWLVPGLALAGPGRWRMTLGWVGTSAAVVAGLLALGFTARVWPVAPILLLPAWLLAAPLAVRATSRDVVSDPSPWTVAGLGLLHWLPALLVLTLTVPGWLLLAANNPASLPALAPGEVAVCRGGDRDTAVARGDLVVAGRPGARFLGRVLGLPGERVEPTEDGWHLDGIPVVRSERELLLPPGDEIAPGTRSVVVRVGDAYLSLWSRSQGPGQVVMKRGAAVDLAADEVYVLALDQSAGASLDSRAHRGFPLERVDAARCLLAWSPTRTARIGRPLAIP